MTMQHHISPKINRRAVFGGAHLSVAPSVDAKNQEGDNGRTILELIRRLEICTQKSHALDALIMADKNRPDVTDLRAEEAIYEAEIERLTSAIANFECRSVEDVLYQLAYFTDTDAYAYDKTTDFCEFWGTNEQYAKIMKSFARIVGVKPIDTVHQLLSPSTRPLGY